MLKIFLSSTYQDLGEARSEILKTLDSAFEGVGMEDFIPDGTSSHEICINDLKKSDIVIFLLSSNYGSLIDECQLKEQCKADCVMKKGTGDGYRISYTHCEYKTTVAEGILHQTYKVLDGWDTQDRPELKQFEEEFSKEMWTRIPDINDPTVVPLICKNLATKIVRWHTDDELNFKKFVDREDVLNEIIDNIDSKIEVWGIGGVGKTALIQVALLVQKLKGKNIVTIGTIKTYKSGSGFEDFRKKFAKDQYITDSDKTITIYDVVKALEKVKLIPNAKEIITSLVDKNKIREYLSKFLREKQNLIVFMDDFHLATETVVDLVKSLESIILSSRKNSYIGKDICITGINEKDREDLINLFNPKIPEKAKNLIKRIAEGHPVATHLLVKNYNDIDFDKIKDFDLRDADDEQVTDFYKRVIEEIFSNNPQALSILKNLAVLNTALPTNIDKESVLNSYNVENVRKTFKALGDTGMLTKREGKEGTYEFYFKHIQDYLEDEAKKESHAKAVEYYERKKEILGENIDDTVEVLYHKVKSNPTKELVDEILDVKKKIQPVHYGFKRLIEVGEELKALVEEEYKAPILVVLGMLYADLGRFEEAEHAYTEALEIYKELADKNTDAYKPEVATTQNNLGLLYADLGRFEEAETAYTEALEIRKELADQNPDEYNPAVASTQNNLGILYRKLGRFEEAETAYTEALEIRKKLAEKNPDAYNPAVASTQNNLGVLFDDLGRFEEAETAYTEALEIYRVLADKNPDAYNPAVADTQNNLGILYRKLGRFEEAEHTYTEALEIRKKLADKNPDAYTPDVAMTQNNLGTLYADLGKFEEAEHAYTKALEIYKELADKNPDTYTPDVAMTQNNLGTLYADLRRFEEAEHAYTEALEIRKKLADQNPEAYLFSLTKTQDALGVLYHNTKNYSKAERSYKEVLQVYEQLAEQYPQVYLSHVIRTLGNLRMLYNDTKRPEEAEKIAKKIEDLEKKKRESTF